MGMDVSAVICYGMEFEEGYEFPWSDIDDIDTWWREELGFKHKKNIWKDGESGYIDGVTEEEKDFYYQEIRDFDQANPCPVTAVYCGSMDGCYSTVVAVPEPMIRGSWNGATKFDPNEFNIPSDVLYKYYEFMNKYFEDIFEGGKWLLTCSLG
jgi:hypothetical protein